MNIGDVIVMNARKGSFYRYLIRWLTGQPYTHTAFGIGNVAGVNSIFEADLCMATTPTSVTVTDDNIDWEIYEVIGISNEKKLQYVSILYEAYAGETYGFAQLPWFAYRALAEQLGYDVRGQKNWSRAGQFCSELTYYLLKMYALDYPALDARLNEWTPGTISPGDIANICHEFNNIFIRKVI